MPGAQTPEENANDLMREEQERRELLTRLREDEGLSVEQLDDKYNPDGDGGHPIYTRADWREEVANGNTIAGYWLWLHSTLIEAIEELETELE